MKLVHKILRDHPRKGDKWIGLEVEVLAVSPKGKILRYKPDIQLLLEALVREKGWKVQFEHEGNFLRIKNKQDEISLEPGGQFEMDIAPQKTIFEVEEAQKKFNAEIQSLPFSKDWSWLSLGLNPHEVPDEIPLLPSRRYQLMDTYFKQHGTRGREMMRLSAGLQINLDFETEQEAVEMLRVAFYLSPIFNTIFANSPYLAGKKTGRKSERYFVWSETDPLRCGFLPMVFEEGFTLNDYADYVESTPLMYAFDSEGKVFDPEGKSLKELPEDLAQVNAMSALRQIFTEVRLKPCCIEMRCFDALPEVYRYAAVALSVGLLYDKKARLRVIEKFKNVSFKELKNMMAEGATQGLAAAHLRTLAAEMHAWATEGLQARGFKEEKFLKPVEDLITKGQTPADLLLSKMGEQPSLKGLL